MSQRINEATGEQEVTDIPRRPEAQPCVICGEPTAYSLADYDQIAKPVCTKSSCVDAYDRGRSEATPVATGPIPTPEYVATTEGIITKANLKFINAPSHMRTLHDLIVEHLRAAYNDGYRDGQRSAAPTPVGPTPAPSANMPLPAGALETLLRRLGGKATFTRDELRRGEQQSMVYRDDGHTISLSVRWDT